MSPEAQAVLDFWFTAADSPEHGMQRPEWFRKDPAFDALIASRFGALVESAIADGLDGWAAEAESALARVLLLDQFTRNIYRGTPRAFDGDAQALAAARSMVAAQQDAALLPVQRSFVYLPFEHAEDLRAQDEAVLLFRQLEADAPNLTGLLDYALRHREIVARFGRFPHRNKVLGRESTAQELEFLEQPGSGF
jgi:uncharacterized protein (DUF924 family)